jgi:deoxycytidine triphosphate deaminase
MLQQAPDLDFAQTEEEAVNRANWFKRFDPFPEVPSALLSSAEIEDYIRVTAMLFPFRRDDRALKPASYEVRPGQKFVWWREDDDLIEEDITEDGTYELPANSIRYMQIEPRIRLPDYIAIRFNLRIKHVHRGLLLGTGPLVDPGFGGDILIPLHNLTSDPYRIRGDEGLIWIEFTKTTAAVRKAEPSYVRRGVLRPMEPHKIGVTIRSYFQRANEGRPIRSSIPEAVRHAEARAEGAERSARLARDEAAESNRVLARANLRYFGFSIVAALAVIVTLGVGLYQYYGQIYANVQSTLTLASAITMSADQAKSDANRALDDAAAFRRDLATATAQIDDLRNQLGAVSRELSALRPSAPALVQPPRR